MGGPPAEVDAWALRTYRARVPGGSWHNRSEGDGNDGLPGEDRAGPPGLRRRTRVQGDARHAPDGAREPRGGWIRRGDHRGLSHADRGGHSRRGRVRGRIGGRRSADSWSPRRVRIKLDENLPSSLVADLAG